LIRATQQATAAASSCATRSLGSVAFSTADFTTRTAARTFDEAVESDRALYTTARDLLARLRSRRRMPARLIGIAASHLTDGASTRQLGLFDDPAAALETDRDRSISRVTDRVRDRFGRKAIVPGRLLDR
jgi:hypothetical protein